MKRMTNRLLAARCAAVFTGMLLSIPIVSFAQDYFQASGIPVQRSAISSAEFRTEFSNIETLLSDKLPAYTGNGDKFVVVNAGGTALTSITPAAALTAIGAPSLSANETVTGQWTFEGRLDIDNGISLRLYDSTDTDFADFSHDGTDFNTAFTTTTDWNLTGITALSAGTVDADFDAITATSYGGITEANLLDKSANETVSGTYTFTAEPILNNAIFLDAKESGGTARQIIGVTSGNLVQIGNPNLLLEIRGSATDVTGALTAASYGGITEANLLDKAAAETISGVWAFSNTSSTFAGASDRINVTDESVDTVTFPIFVNNTPGSQVPHTGTNLTFNSATGNLFATRIAGILQENLLDKTATESVSGAYTFSGGLTVTTANIVAGTVDADFDALTATSYGGITEANLVDKSAAITTPDTSAAEIGYKGSPLNTQNGNYTLVLGDAAKTIFKASGGAGETITIPANSAVAYPIGTIIVVLNGGGGTLLLAITTDTLTQVGTGNTGTRTLADDAMVSIIKVTATAWYVSGTGAT